MIPIHYSPLLPEFTDVQKTIKLSFRERWINPLLHPATIPFEPWVKVKITTVRERSWYYLGHKIICHPNNAQFVTNLCY